VQVYQRVSGPMETRGAGIVVQGELINLLRTHDAAALPTTHDVASWACSKTVAQFPHSQSMVCDLAMSGTHIRAGGNGPPPAKAERGDLQVEVFYANAYSTRFHT
jgi:hypothetical protein